MIQEVTSRTKKCTSCGLVGHNSVMHAHTCDVVVKEIKEVKTTKKGKK